MPKILIEFAGLSGTGKSSLIRKLCASYGYPHPAPEARKRWRFGKSLDLLPFGIFYVVNADRRLRSYAMNVVVRTYHAHQPFTGIHLLDEGIFSYFSHVSQYLASENGFFVRSLKKGGGLPHGLILLACDPVTRVSRIRNRRQGCLDLQLDDSANFAKSEKWEGLWRANVDSISNLGVAILRIDTSQTTIDDSAQAIHTWISGLEERIRREK